MGNHRARITASVLHGCKRITRLAAALLCDERGQGTLEYILILSVTVVGAGKISHEIVKALDKGILSLGGQLEKDLKTGRLPLSVWSN